MGSPSQIMTTTHTLTMIMLHRSRPCLMARTTTQALPLVCLFPPPPPHPSLSPGPPPRPFPLFSPPPPPPLPLPPLLYVAQQERAPVWYYVSRTIMIIPSMVSMMVSTAGLCKLLQHCLCDWQVFAPLPRPGASAMHPGPV